VRVRRGNRRTDCRRAVRGSRRAGETCGSARRARGVFPDPRGSDPAAIGRHPERHPRHRAVLKAGPKACTTIVETFLQGLQPCVIVRPFTVLCLVMFGVAPSLSARRADVIRSVGAIPAGIAGRFRDPIGFQQSASGQYYVFDRRAHTVYGIDEEQTSAWEIVKIGGEPGRIIDPTAFSIEPNGTFVVADAPNNRERIQIFSAAGFRLGGFMLPGRSRPRVQFNSLVLNGIGSLQYTGSSILLSQPETGALIAEYTLSRGVNRTLVK